MPALLIGGCDRRSTASGQATVAEAPPATDLANQVSPDEVAPEPQGTATPADGGVDVIGKLDRTHAGTPAPRAAFSGADGRTLTLAGFAGKPVLLNLWATWCGPCVAEMPTLDRIAAEGKVRVVAVSQDPPGSVGRIAPYFEKAGLKTLARYTDPALAMSAALDNPSLPTSILYDSRGREVWRMTGGMDWTSPTAHDLLAEAR